MWPEHRLVIVAAAIALAAAACDSGEQSLRGAQKIRICHAASSASNPYVSNEPSKDGTVSGHDGHQNDVIPPFDYIDDAGNTQQYPGKNWDTEGQEIYDSGCRVLASPTEAPPVQPTSTEPAPTTTSATSVTVPSEETTTTGQTAEVTGPTEETTTTAAAPTTPGGGTAQSTIPEGQAAGATTAPRTGAAGSGGGDEPSGAGAAGLTTVPGEVAGAGGQAAVTTAMVPPAPASLPGPDGTTPATGRETPPMLLLGTLLVAGGAVATGLARRHPRRESHGP